MNKNQRNLDKNRKYVGGDFLLFYNKMFLCNLLHRGIISVNGCHSPRTLTDNVPTLVGMALDQRAVVLLLGAKPVSHQVSQFDIF